MIRVLLCQPPEADTESILRSISSELDPDTPLSRDLEQGAGSTVAERLRAMGTLPVGAAVITPGGDLPASFLIHVVLQSAEEPIRTEGVKTALQNGLRRAQEWGLKSVAMAPLGIGAGNLEAEEAAGVMIPLIQEHLLCSEYPQEVVITVANEYEHDVFSRAVEATGRQAREH